MKPRDVSVSIFDNKDSIRVWCAAFTLKGTLPHKDGKVDEAVRKRIQKAIEKVLSQVEFPEEM